MKFALILTALFAFSSGTYFDQEPLQEPPVFRVITHNVRVGFNYPGGAANLTRWSAWLAGKKPDVVLLQEFEMAVVSPARQIKPEKRIVVELRVE